MAANSQNQLSVAQEYTQGLYTIFQNYITSDNGIVEQFKLDFSGMINKIDNIAAKSIKKFTMAEDRSNGISETWQYLKTKQSLLMRPLLSQSQSPSQSSSQSDI